MGPGSTWSLCRWEEKAQNPFQTWLWGQRLTTENSWYDISCYEVERTLDYLILYTKKKCCTFETIKKITMHVLHKYIINYIYIESDADSCCFLKILDYNYIRRRYCYRDFDVTCNEWWTMVYSSLLRFLNLHKRERKWMWWWIAGGATLIFDTELVAVNGKPSSEGKTKNELWPHPSS